MHWIVLIFYGFAFVPILILLIITITQNQRLHAYYYLTVNVILIASAFLYLPIILSIQKFAHLASARLNRPQRYVFWQMVVVVIGKCINIPIVLSTVDFKMRNIQLYCKIGDALLMPPTVMLTYLGCNRRNVNAVWKSLKEKEMLTYLRCNQRNVDAIWKSLKGKNYKEIVGWLREKMSTSVAPQQRYSESVVN